MTMRSFLLTVAIILALSVSMPVGPRRMDASSALQSRVFAQNKPKIQGPPKRQKQKTSGEDEEDRPVGQTAISVAVDLVSFQALVTDQKGNIVTGLGRNNFTIYEDNVKQEIVNFAPVEANITAVLLVEFSRQVQYIIYDVWNSIYTFANSLRKGDWVAVIGYDMRPTILCDFTQDHSELMDTLGRFSVPTWSESNLSDALIDTLDRVEEIDGKVAIILVSTGLDTFSKHTYDEALNKCKAANASIYAISVGQNFRLRAEAAGIISQEGNMELLMSDNRLKSFAEYTGGEAYFPRFETELPSIFGNISTMLRSQYSIAYVSSNTKKDGKYRKIRVDVNSDLMEKGKPAKLKVFSRKGYLAKES
jgi:VWFA-related protein